MQTGFPPLYVPVLWYRSPKYFLTFLFLQILQVSRSNRLPPHAINLGGQVYVITLC
jgi:hypothetical protein